MYFVLYILVYTEPFNLYTQHHSSLHWILWVTDANQCPQSPSPRPNPTALCLCWRACSQTQGQTFIQMNNCTN